MADTEKDTEQGTFDDPYDAPPDLAAATKGRITDLVLDIDGFEGPIDVLLTLAREQKLDLLQISILQLAEQYLAFVQQARRLHIELAADYLVMAAWLAYLKSRLLLPQEEDEHEPSGEEMAAALAFQLQRLESMKAAGEKLLQRPRLGRDRFAFGQPEGTHLVSDTVIDLSFFDLLKAYGDIQVRNSATTLSVEPLELYSVDDAIRRLKQFLGECPDWTMLQSFLPAEVMSSLVWRSAISSHFVAVLELAREGKLDLHQEGQAYSPIFIRGRK